MVIKDIVQEVINTSHFKPDNIETVKAFTNTYIANLVNICELENKDHVIYLSGPVSNVPDYEQRFGSIEFAAHIAWGAHNIYVLNPIKVLSIVDEFNFTYADKMILCYCLLSICNVLIYDNRDKKFESSVGTFSELSYAIGRGGIEILDYKYILDSIKYKDFLISKDASQAAKLAQRSNKEIIEDIAERTIGNKKVGENNETE